ncbi:MAG: zinc-binding protein [Chloroflexota bacterium]
MTAYVDKMLTCRDCGATFVFSAGEQSFYAAKGLQHEPQRCPTCRANRRRERAGVEEQPAREAGRGVSTRVTCANCGAETTVPFVPRNSRPVYCSSCYSKAKAGLL